MPSRDLVVGFAFGVASVATLAALRRAFNKGAVSVTDLCVVKKAFQRVSCRPNHGPMGSVPPCTHSKRGVEHTWNNGVERVLVVGGACSEIFGGSQLVKVLQPGADYEAAVLANVSAGKPAPPLPLSPESLTNCNTSSGLKPFAIACRL